MIIFLQLLGFICLCIVGGAYLSYIENKLGVPFYIALCINMVIGFAFGYFAAGYIFF